MATHKKKVQKLKMDYASLYDSEKTDKILNNIDNLYSKVTLFLKKKYPDNLSIKSLPPKIDDYDPSEYDSDESEEDEIIMALLNRK